MGLISRVSSRTYRCSHVLMSPGFKHSGAQKQVIKLFRDLLRATKDVPKLNSEVKTEFRKNQSIPKKDFPIIERLLRTGRHRLAEQTGNQKASGFTREIKPDHTTHKLERKISKVADKRL